MLKFQNKKGFDNRRKQRSGHHRGTPPPGLLTEREVQEYLEQKQASDEVEEEKLNPSNIKVEREV